MYSLVLMTAMTGTPEAPQFNGYFRNLFSGCNGCSGSSSAAPAGCSGSYAPRSGCYGGCYGSSYAAGCNGCQGWLSNLRSRVRSWFEPPAGCCGGSGSGYGCTGSGYGCYGSGYACWGAAYSCFGGPAPSIPAVPYDAYPSYPALPNVAPPPTIPYAPPEVAPGPGSLNTGLRPANHTESSLVSGSATERATVIVKLPADARLYADAKLLTLTGAERKFVTPALPTGREFAYRFRVEYERGGEIVSVTKKVPVKAGGTATIEFTDLTATNSTPQNNATQPSPGPAVAATPTSNSTDPSALVPSVAPAPSAKPEVPVVSPAAPATERATITVKLPPGAALFVDGRKSPSSEPNRVFTTPPLPGGREFAYVLTAEVVRNGQKETFTQKVPFRAGERVEVDFTAQR